jgi:hypothetical protein
MEREGRLATGQAARAGSWQHLLHDHARPARLRVGAKMARRKKFTVDEIIEAIKALSSKDAREFWLRVGNEAGNADPVEIETLDSGIDYAQRAADWKETANNLMNHVLHLRKMKDELERKLENRNRQPAVKTIRLSVEIIRKHQNGRSLEQLRREYFPQGVVRSVTKILSEPEKWLKLEKKVNAGIYTGPTS